MDFRQVGHAMRRRGGAASSHLDAANQNYGYQEAQTEGKNDGKK